MSTRNLIDAIASGSALNIESAFEDTMAEKVSVQIEAKRLQIAQTMFTTEEVDLDEEQLDEEQLDALYDDQISESVTPEEAHNILSKHGGLDKNFFTLSSDHVHGLLDAAKKAKYKKSASAPGSTARMFHQHLTNKASKHSVSESYTELDEEMSDAAHELVLHADNDSHLYRSSHEPIVSNLKKKVVKGTYDHEKAKKLWSYHADRAAQSYAKEHGDGKTPWHKQFTTADRKQAASHFADSARDTHLNEEQLDELSKDTLGSYVKKASRDVGQLGRTAGRNRAKATSPWNPEDGKEDMRKHDVATSIQAKRIKGIATAVDKLTKTEEVEEQEEQE